MEGTALRGMRVFWYTKLLSLGKAFGIIKTLMNTKRPTPQCTCVSIFHIRAQKCACICRGLAFLGSLQSSFFRRFSLHQVSLIADPTRASVITLRVVWPLSSLTDITCFVLDLKGNHCDFLEHGKNIDMYNTENNERWTYLLFFEIVTVRSAILNPIK